MLTAHGLSKAYSTNTLFNNITLTINPGERVGLIGPNGSGKTTLMRLLSGDEVPDSGVIVRTPPDLRVGYLAQGFDSAPTTTFGDMLADHGGDARRQEARLAMAAEALAAAPSDHNLQLAYQTALDQLSSVETARAEAILCDLGLSDISPETPVARLSGGQKTRLGLALVLISSPQLLLLDEPTNHLDIAMLTWLEEWLQDFAGAALIISHDRVFLDRTVDRILDLDPLEGRLREYAGNYSDSLEQARREHDQQWAAWRDQEVAIRRMQQDIARTMAQASQVERTTKPNQPHVRRLAKKVARKAKSREKKLERYMRSDERVEKPPLVWQMKMEFAETAHIGRDVMRLEDLSVGYAGAEPLLTHLDATIRSGQRVVLTGANGAGKTTLLRTIAGLLPPISGRIHLGGSVRLGYMAQEQESLDPHLTPLQTIQSAAELSETDARSFLHYFLFEGDEALRPNGLLSYGERARLALARLVAQGSTFLLLDEPINHLDIPSRARFEQALSHYQGTVLAVVHDRYFIERFATDVWTVRDGALDAELRGMTG